MKVFWFGYMEQVVCNRDDLIMNPLFDFKPMKGLEYWEIWKCLGVRVMARASTFSMS